MHSLVGGIIDSNSYIRVPPMLTDQYAHDKIFGNENDSTGRMILVFTTTFIIITSTSVAHGPFAAHAASTKQQQNKHKSTVTVFDSIDNANNVPEGSTQSGITRPGKYATHLLNAFTHLE